MWPKFVDMTDNECKLMLRKLELEAYGNMVSALRAQGPLTDEKKSLLMDIAAELHIPRERYSAEIRRAVNDEKLSTIAQQIYGPNTEIKWAIEGRREIPIIPRLHAQTAYSFLADKIANITAAENAKLPFPTKANRKEVEPVKPDKPKRRSVKKPKQENEGPSEENSKEKSNDEKSKALPSDILNDGCVKSAVDKNENANAPLQKVFLGETFGNNFPIIKSGTNSPVKKRRVVAKTTVNKPLTTVAPKNAKNGKAVATPKTMPSSISKPTQIISAVKQGTSTGHKVVAVGSSIPPSALKVVNKNFNSQFSSNPTFPTSSPVVTGIKVMTPRSSVTTAASRSEPGTGFPRFMRPNLASVRPNVTNNLTGVKHNVVVMQKNPPIKRNVTFTHKDTPDKVLKRKMPNSVPLHLESPHSKVPKLNQDSTPAVSTSSQGSVRMKGANQNSFSNLPSQLSKPPSGYLPSTSISNNVKTYTKSKLILPLDHTKSKCITSSITPAKSPSPAPITSVPKPLPLKPAQSPVIPESKPGPLLKKITKAPAPSTPVMNRILTPSSSSVPVASSTKIIITDNEGKVLGTVPSSSITSPQSQLNLLFASSAPSTDVLSKSTTVSSNSAGSNDSSTKVKSVVIPSSKSTTCYVSLAGLMSSPVPENQTLDVDLSEIGGTSSGVCDTQNIGSKSQFNFTVEQEPIVVNVPSTSDTSCSSSFIPSYCLSTSTEVNEEATDLNETDAEGVGILDPVTGVYSFPFDENESNQDSTVSVNSLPSSLDLTDQLDCNSSTHMLAVSPGSESANDSSLSHMVEETVISECKLDQSALDENCENETVNECDISNISVTEVTLEETLECFEADDTQGMYSEEIVEKDSQSIDSVFENL
nr:PREDICTED: BRCA2-interacting transcriptional repressor EMSY [Bemisia tabaci]